jgi:protein transport protein SEC24
MGGLNSAMGGMNLNKPPQMQQQMQMQQPPPPGPAVGGPRMFTPNPQNIGAPPSPQRNQQQQQQQFQQPGSFPQPPMGPPGGSGVGMMQPKPPQMMMQPGPGAPGMVPQQQGGGMGPPGVTGGGVGGGPVDIFQDNIDTSIQAPSRILRLTTSNIPSNAALAHATKVPMGAVIRPLAPYCDETKNANENDAGEEEEVPVIQPGAAGIIRCKRCRTYINAFVTWLENGRRWRCNICAQLNETPTPYFCHLDESGQRRDRYDRPELSRACIEYIAPSEYMVRPPQPPSYFFVIDVSAVSVRSGMLQSVADAIKASLDELPGSPRTQVGFLTYDDSVHYYSLKSGLAQPQMLVVADLVELFVPAPDDLLVNLQESRDVIDIFLENLPTMFEGSTTASSSCLGPALKAAFTVTKHIGGKMSVFQSILPTLGDGALVPRENHHVMGTVDEVKLLRPGTNWYKDTAVEFSRSQISVDMYLFPRSYVDVASLGDLPKLTAGTLRTYPGFNYDTDGPRFESELCRSLTQHTAFESVMRIRCTRGMKITNFYGNFFIRGSDLLALPNCNADSVFAFDFAHDEHNLNSSFVTIQSALLYTSSEGERRIRVITQAVPVTSLASEVINSVDGDATSALLAKQALDVAIKTNLDNARGKLQQACVDLIRASKDGDKPRRVSGYAAPPPMGGQQQGGDGSEGDSKSIPENLKLLPLYTLATMKNVAFRGGTDVHPDERVHAMHRLNNMDVTASKHFVYPRMFSLHNMSSSAGLPSAGNATSEKVAGKNLIELPSVLDLTIDRLASNGIFLLDNGLDMFLWVGRSSDPAILNSLFGTNSLEGVDMSQVLLQTSGNDFASRVNAIVSALREDDSPETLIAKVTIVREGDHGLESRFFWHLVEDRASFNGGTYSYEDFMDFVNSGGSQGQGMPPGPGRGGPSRGGPPPPGPPGMPNQQMPMAPLMNQQGPPQRQPMPPPMNQQGAPQRQPMPPPGNMAPPPMPTQMGPPMPPAQMHAPPSAPHSGPPMPPAPPQMQQSRGMPPPPGNMPPPPMPMQSRQPMPPPPPGQQYRR